MKELTKACEILNISERDILSKSRKRLIVRKREFISYFMRYEMHMKLTQIGKILKRDHSTIINQLNNLENDKYFTSFNWLRYLVFKRIMNKDKSESKINYIYVENKYRNKFENLLRNNKGKVINETLIDRVMGKL